MSASRWQSQSSHHARLTPVKDSTPLPRQKMFTTALDAGMREEKQPGTREVGDFREMELRPGQMLWVLEMKHTWEADG